MVVGATAYVRMSEPRMSRTHSKRQMNELSPRTTRRPPRYRETEANAGYVECHVTKTAVACPVLNDHRCHPRTRHERYSRQRHSTSGCRVARCPVEGAARRVPVAAVRHLPSEAAWRCAQACAVRNSALPQPTRHAQVGKQRQKEGMRCAAETASRRRYSVPVPRCGRWGPW